jgi:hypothetical protein
VPVSFSSSRIAHRKQYNATRTKMERLAVASTPGRQDIHLELLVPGL